MDVLFTIRQYLEQEATKMKKLPMLVLEGEDM